MLLCPNIVGVFCFCFQLNRVTCLTNYFLMSGIISRSYNTSKSVQADGNIISHRNFHNHCSFALLPFYCVTIARPPELSLYRGSLNCSVPKSIIYGLQLPLQALKKMSCTLLYYKLKENAKFLHAPRHEHVYVYTAKFVI